MKLVDIQDGKGTLSIQTERGGTVRYQGYNKLLTLAVRQVSMKRFLSKEIFIQNK
jgi:hypothetical protein